MNAKNLKLRKCRNPWCGAFINPARLFCWPCWKLVPWSIKLRMDILKSTDTRARAAKDAVEHLRHIRS